MDTLRVSTSIYCSFNEENFFSLTVAAPSDDHHPIVCRDQRDLLPRDALPAALGFNGLFCPVVSPSRTPEGLQAVIVQSQLALPNYIGSKEYWGCGRNICSSCLDHLDIDLVLFIVQRSRSTLYIVVLFTHLLLLECDTASSSL